MSMFDDPFDRDGDGHLDFDEEAERDYFFFDDDAYGGSGNSSHSYSSFGSGNSGYFYSSSGSGHRKAASGGSSAGRTTDKRKTDEELIAEYVQKVAQKAERKAARREKIKNSKKKILIVSGIIAVLIAACVVIIIFSVINRQNRYVEEVAGYYVGHPTSTQEEYISKTIIITDRKNISFDGRQWKVTKIREDGTKIWIKSLDGSFYTCELCFLQSSNGRAYIMTVNYDEECGGSFYHYYTESEYKFKLKKLK